MIPSLPVSLTLDLEPVAASRPRVTRQGHAYYAPKYRAFLDEARELVRAAWTLEPIAEPVAIHLRFSVARPKSHLNAAGEVKPGKPSHPYPDLDNYIKAALDVLEPVVIENDRQVASIQAIKRYGSPGIQIGVEKAGHWARPFPSRYWLALLAQIREYMRPIH